MPASGFECELIANKRAGRFPPPQFQLKSLHSTHDNGVKINKASAWQKIIYLVCLFFQRAFCEGHECKLNELLEDAHEIDLMPWLYFVNKLAYREKETDLWKCHFLVL